MVGAAFELERERTQPGAARRDLAAAHALERAAVGPRVRHRRVSRDARREAMPLGERQVAEAALDALVRVAEALFEAQHLLADDREAEVARLDHAGVHRPDGDLVHAVAGDAHERVVVDRGDRALRFAVAAQREKSGRPAVVPQPGPQIAVLRTQTQQIVQRALHAQRGRIDPGNARDAGRSGGDRELGDAQPLGVEIGGQHLGRRRVAPLLAAPQREQARAVAVHRARHVLPLPGLDRGAPRRRLAAEPVPLQLRARAHGSAPISAAAPRYQSASHGGM